MAFKLQSIYAFLLPLCRLGVNPFSRTASEQTCFVFTASFHLFHML